MNLYIRLFILFLTARWRARIRDITLCQSLNFRVLPSDLDTNMHMNNGRYLTIMDLGRLDLVIRTGLMNLMVKRSCVPVLAAATIRYRLPLAPFQAYTLETQVMCWDNKWVYMEQRFVIRKGAKAGAVAAVALLKGNFWDRRKSETVPTGTLLTLLGIGELSPPMPDHIARWLESEDALKAVTSA